MAEYTPPRGRQAIKNKVKVVLMDWIEENLDDSGDTSTAWDDADDCAARTYQDEIEDGKSHAGAMKEAKVQFWEELRAALGNQIEGVFERLGKE